MIERARSASDAPSKRAAGDAPAVAAVHESVSRQPLGLRFRTQRDFAHVDVLRLVEHIRDRTRHRFRGHGVFVSGRFQLLLELKALDVIGESGVREARQDRGHPDMTREFLPQPIRDGEHRRLRGRIHDLVRAPSCAPTWMRCV